MVVSESVEIQCYQRDVVFSHMARLIGAFVVTPFTTNCFNFCSLTVRQQVFVELVADIRQDFGQQIESG